MLSANVHCLTLGYIKTKEPIMIDEPFSYISNPGCFVKTELSNKLKIAR